MESSRLHLLSFILFEHLQGGDDLLKLYKVVHVGQLDSINLKEALMESHQLIQSLLSLLSFCPLRPCNIHGADNNLHEAGGVDRGHEDLAYVDQAGEQLVHS